MTDAPRDTEQELQIERYRALEREVTDPLALGLLRDIVLELEGKLGGSCARSHPSAGQRGATMRAGAPRVRPGAAEAMPPDLCAQHGRSIPG